MHGSQSVRRAAAALAFGLALAAAAAWPQPCVPPPYPLDPEWGDAPEGQLAYPDLPVAGLFPTCFGGPSNCIQHAQIVGGTANNAYFGPNLDYDRDGNGGVCPPPQYENDECEFPVDGDAGLVMPTAFTFGPHGPPFTAIPCSGAPPQVQSLGYTCGRAVWGTDIDIMLTNNLFAAGPAPHPQVVFLNVLVDLDRDGMWSPFPVGPMCAAQIPEHVVRNLPVPIGFSGLASQLPNAPFDIGPDSGYVWVRFTLTPEAVLFPFDGSGFWEGGETEDYMLDVSGDTPPAEYGDAPQDEVAYPPYPFHGQFPTCVLTGGYVQRPPISSLYFGSGVDFEFEGNADDCAFNVYDNDECFGGEAGLVVPRPYTIRRTLPGFVIEPCSPPGSALGTECTAIQWGTGLDLQITNNLPFAANFNMLADWDHDGRWGGPGPSCGLPTRTQSEHVVRNLVVPAGFSGLLSQLSPPNRILGYNGYAWTRFTLSTAAAPGDWDGSGNMGEGESEDYLLYIAQGAVDTEGSRLGVLRVGEAAPNPTFGGTRIDLDLPAQAEVSVEVYDAKGRRVRDLGVRAVARGVQQVEWDGADAAGKRPAAGVYFLQFEIGGQVLTRRVLLLN